MKRRSRIERDDETLMMRERPAARDKAFIMMRRISYCSQKRKKKRRKKGINDSNSSIDKSKIKEIITI